MLWARREPGDGQSTITFGARSKASNWNDSQPSSKGATELLRRSNQPCVADPHPDFFSRETEAQNSTAGSYADSVAEQGMQTRSLAC